MKFLSASVLSIFAATASAADCFGQPQSNLGKTYGDAYWDARAQMCSNTNCEYQKDCTTYAKKTVQGWRIKLTANVSLKRQKLNGNGFKDCWVCANIPPLLNLSIRVRANPVDNNRLPQSMLYRQCDQTKYLRRTFWGNQF